MYSKNTYFIELLKQVNVFHHFQINVTIVQPSFHADNLNPQCLRYLSTGTFYKKNMLNNVW